MLAVNTLLGRRIFIQQCRRPNGSRNEISAAIWTDAVQARRHATAAKSTFECTNHRIRRIGRKIAIARFAIGTELKHFAGCQALPPVSASPRTRKAPASMLARFSGVSAYVKTICDAPSNALAGSFNSIVIVLPKRRASRMGL